MLLRVLTIMVLSIFVAMPREQLKDPSPDDKQDSGGFKIKIEDKK